MDDQERERLTRRHRDLMEKARDAVEQARRVRDGFSPVSVAAHLRSVKLADRARALGSEMQDLRVWSQDARAKARESVDASRLLSSRNGKR